jgi:type I restriction enzyme S subunit
MSARGRFKPYPAYKDAGVEWLGEIPAHWNVKRTKFAARLRSGHTPSRQNLEYWADCTIPWFSLADVWQIRDGQVEYVTDTNEKISELGLANSSARLLPKGTVMLSRTASVGFATIMGVDMATTQDFVNWVCGPDLRPEYLLQVFRSMHQEFRRLTMGSTHQTIYMSDVGQFSTPLPSIAEQDRIVGFVRERTREIDSLVAKKERLIELLQEQRTALITRAVTKGLDPNVPIKDSGVEWLGEIPAHWEVKKITWLFSIGSGTTPTSEDPRYYGGDTPWITTSELRESVVLTTEKYVTQAARREYSALKLYPVGSVAVAMYGATIGRLGIFGIDATVNQACCVFSNPRGIEMPFWFYWLQMRRPHLVSLGYGGGQPNLSQDLLRSVRLPTPPVPEQSAIVAFLDRQTARIDALVAKVRDAIERLKELRTALISAAVTGKIDVREEVA